MSQRTPRIEHPAYLAYIRTLPCLVCGKSPSDAAHLRSAARRYGKRLTGMGEKPDDKWTLPLCRKDHTAQHRENELAWWAGQGIVDPFAVAKALYENRPPMAPPRAAPSERKIKPRKPKAQRARVGPSRPMQSRNDLRRKDNANV